MSKEAGELVAAIEEILQHDPLANTGAFPCGLCGRRQTQGHFPTCPFTKARKAIEYWYAVQQSKERAVTSEQAQAIQEVAQEMYKISKEHGFHYDEELVTRDGIFITGAKTVSAHIAEWVANLHGEVSELWEAYRNRKLFMKCDKACELTCAEEELADTAIRCMDTSVALGIDLGRAIQIKSAYNQNRAHRHGGKLA